MGERGGSDEKSGREVNGKQEWTSGKNSSVRVCFLS